MKLLRNLKLRSKMLLAFSLVILLMLGALAFGFYGLVNNKKQFVSFQTITDEMKKVENIQTELLSSRIAFNSFVATQNDEMIYLFNEHYSHMESYIYDFINISNNNERVQYVKDIERMLREYNVGFQEIKELNDKIQEYYDKVARSGTEMVDALENIKRIAYKEENKDVLDMSANGLQNLLMARLYVSKFSNFHDYENYQSYLKSYEVYKGCVDSLKGIENEYQYKADYRILKKNINLYAEEMIGLNKSINKLDELIVDMEEIGGDVTTIINHINDTILVEEADYESRVERDAVTMIGAMILVALVAIISSILVVVGLVRMVLDPMMSLTDTFKAIALGEVDLDFRLERKSNDEIGNMTVAFNQFMVKLKDIMNNIKYQNWLKTAQTEINELLRDEEDIIKMSNGIISYLCNYIDAYIGAFYLNNNDELTMTASYAYKSRGELSKTIKLGEGLVGQAALEKKKFVITEIPEDYIIVQSSFGESIPKSIVILPCMYENELMCLVEIGSLEEYTKQELSLLEALSDVIGASVHSAKIRIQMKELLDMTINQAEELQVQHEELRQSNEELEEQTEALRESEARLQTQQEELRISNEELIQRSHELELQKQELDQKNQEIITSQQLIIDKAQALEKANRYKSEFLANMSHELRTPLNSILVLSQLLSNRTEEGSLTAKEKEYASTIHSSGTDLLTLINDILDLSKVEAGKLDLNYDKVYLEDILDECNKLFKPVAEVKKIEFRTELQKGLPEAIISDNMRLSQIIRNLISNAIKFTDSGEVVLAIRHPNHKDSQKTNRSYDNFIAIDVKDTGIGIPRDKQQIIFEAFRQSDGTTSRQYGGTGLGLTISLELSHVLGGQILLDSKEEQGSTFTIILPIVPQKSEENSEEQQNSNTIINNVISYETLHSEQAATIINHNRSKKLLIIEDDKNFATILADLAENKGYDTEVAYDGASGLEKAISTNPLAIILDIGLPDMYGVDLAKKLEEHEKTKNIPIHIISGAENEDLLNMPKSIIGYLKKPVDIKDIYTTLAKLEAIHKNGLKKLLVIGECGGEGFEYFTNLGQVELHRVKSGKEGLKRLKIGDYQCAVLDIKLPDMSGIDFLIQLKEELEQTVPVIIYTDEEIDSQQVDDINQYAESIILKGSKSQDRLIDEVSIFLHDINKNIDENSAIAGINKTHLTRSFKNKMETKDTLLNRRILLVDDDERNLFALLNVLEQYGIQVIIAKNGEEAIKAYKEHVDLDLILMDIMMPKLDGYDAIKEIRKLESNKKIPIIALTAKAMKEDRNKCIEVGANDYMTKPINIEKLISLLKVWIS